MAGFDPSKLRAEEEMGGFQVGSPSDDSFLLELLPSYPSVVKSGRAEEDLWAAPEVPPEYEEDIPVDPRDEEPMPVAAEEEPPVEEDILPDDFGIPEEEPQNMPDEEQGDDLDEFLKQAEELKAKAPATPPPPPKPEEPDIDDDLMSLINESLGGKKSKPVDTKPTDFEKAEPTVDIPTDLPEMPEDVEGEIPTTSGYGAMMQQGAQIDTSVPDIDEGAPVFDFGDMDLPEQPSKITSEFDIPEFDDDGKQEAAPAPKKSKPKEKLDLLDEESPAKKPTDEKKKGKKRAIPLWMKVAAGLGIVMLLTTGAGVTLHFTGFLGQWLGYGQEMLADGGETGSGTEGDASGDAEGEGNASFADGATNNLGDTQGTGENNTASTDGEPAGDAASETLLPEDKENIAAFDAPSPVPIGTEKEAIAASSPAPEQSRKTGDKKRTSPAADQEIRPRKIAATAPRQQKPEDEKPPLIKPPRDAKGLFVVQMYSSPSREDAEAWVEQLRQRGMPNPHIQTQTIRNQTWYRVRFGTYATQAEAEKDAITLGFTDSWVIRLR